MPCNIRSHVKIYLLPHGETDLDVLTLYTHLHMASFDNLFLLTLQN